MFCLFTIILIPIHALAELKMGIVNLDLLFKEIPIYRESQEKIKKQFDPRARNLKTLEQEWNGLNEDYLKNETVMSEKEKKAQKENISTRTNMNIVSLHSRKIKQKTTHSRRRSRDNHQAAGAACERPRRRNEGA